MDPGALADQMQELGASTPSEPVEATERLVGLILGEDPAVAVTATAELLRRSGLPVVSSEGPVVGMPESWVLVDAPVYAELVPALSAAVRRDDQYAIGQFAELLVAIEVSPEPIPFEPLAATIGNWGKAAGDDPLMAFTAAAVRALSGQRGRVFYPAADPADLGLDPLQMVLLAAHAGSDVGTTKTSIESRGPSLVERALGVGVAHAQTDPCGALKALLEVSDNQVVKVVTDELKGKLVDTLKKQLPAGLQQALDQAGKGKARTGKTASVVSTLVLLAGAVVEVKPSKAVTHFKHQAGSTAEHVELVATARFDAGVAQRKLNCYSFAGLDVPEQGPLKDYIIRWGIVQPQRGSIQQGGGALLQSVSADSSKVTQGDKTSSSGQSRFTVKPPVEDPADQGAELLGTAVVSASLDRQEFPLKLGDAMTGAKGVKEAIKGGKVNPYGWAADKIGDIIKELTLKVGLPTQRTPLTVEYHGADILVASGTNSVFLLFYQVDAVYVDLVSCGGKKGPWNGVGGWSGGAGNALNDLWREGQDAILGQSQPEELPAMEVPLSFTTNPDAPPPFPIINENNFLSGQFEFFREARIPSTKYVILSDRRLGRPVGEVEILWGGATMPLADLTFPVVRVESDPRCPAVQYRFDDA